MNDVVFLDMLFQRYSDPLTLVDKMILSRRLEEFVSQFMNLWNQDIEEKTTWEMWLHKVFDQSYSDWTNALKGKQSAYEVPSEDELEMTVRNSMISLNCFVPE